MAKYKFFIEEKEDYDTCGIGYQKITDESGNRLFSVYNLCECPEDAIIGRDLFDAQDYINAVKFGMKLAQNGYNDIEEFYLDANKD